MATERLQLSIGSQIIYCAGAAVAVVVAAVLLLQLVSRYHYRKALDAFHRADYLQTEQELASGINFVSGLFPGDGKRVANLSGDLTLALAQRAQNTGELLEKAEAAASYYRRAYAISPIDLDATMGLAQSVGLLERLYPFLRHKPYPEQALPIYQRLLSLMPVNLYSFELLTRYYVSRRMSDRLNDLVLRNVAVWPPLYFQLKRQAFYSMTMNEDLQKALLKAKAGDIFPRAAARALADIAAMEDDYSGAIAYYLEAEPKSRFKDTSDYYLGLGQLYLKANTFTEAAKVFSRAMDTGNREERLASIYGGYRNQKLYAPFLQFARRVEEQWPLLERVKLYKAECYLALEKYELALSQLIQVKSPRLQAESFYLQAQVAERLGDWDTMELRSQRATVLDPTDYRYHYLFSRALQKQQKFAGAEQAATAAIETSKMQNAWMFNNRAWVRWALHNYEAARDDWERAIHLSPQNASLYANLARVFEEGGNIKEAVKNLQKAIKLDSKNENLQKKLAELKEKMVGVIDERH